MTKTTYYPDYRYLSWESVWCNYNQITPRSGEELRRIRTLYQGIGDGLVSGYEAWHPHVPVSPVIGVFASEFQRAGPGNFTLWTVVNRAGRDVGGTPAAPALQLPCGPNVCPDGVGCRWFDIWAGLEVTDNVVCTTADGIAAMPMVLLEAGGYGAVLRTVGAEEAPTPEFLAEMARMAEKPLSSFENIWRPLQQALIVPPLHLGCGAEGTPCLGPPMVLLGFQLYDFRCSSNQVEPFGDQLKEAVDVQMPWEPHPMRHHERTLGVGFLWVDITPVTNEAYADFLAESGWRPATAQNWLKSWELPSGGGLPTVPTPANQSLYRTYISHHGWSIRPQCDLYFNQHNRMMADVSLIGPSRYLRVTSAGQ